MLYSKPRVCDSDVTTASGQTLSTRLRHRSGEEGAGKRCWEGAGGLGDRLMAQQR